jgi:hypothetical protein
VPEPSKRPHVPLTRLTVLAAAAVLTTAGLAVAPSPASATALSGVAQATISFDPGAGCTEAPADPPGQDGPLQSDGLGTDLTVSGATTATKTGDPTDTTALSASMHATASATEVAGQPGSLDATLTGSMSNSAVKGALTACDSSNTVSVVTQSYINLTQLTTIELRTSMRSGPDSTVAFTVVNLGGIVPTNAAEVVVDQNGTGTRLIDVPAGSYAIVTQLFLTRDTLDVIATPTLSNFAMSVHADFRRPGAASSGAKGAGTKYVTLPEGLDCSGGTAAVTYTKSAKPAKKKKGAKGKKPTLSNATFYVDGNRVKTVKKPDRDTTTLLGGFSADDRVTIEAVVKVRGKGTVELRRTYLPCS